MNVKDKIVIACNPPLSKYCVSMFLLNVKTNTISVSKIKNIIEYARIRGRAPPLIPILKALATITTMRTNTRARVIKVNING